jgi:anti-sigma B factor antagonist
LSQQFAAEVLPWTNGTVVVAVCGEVDLATAPEVEAALRAAAGLAARRVVVNLSETTFFDSSAVRALYEGARPLKALGAEVCIVCSDRIRTVLEIAAVDRVFELLPTIDAAL